MGPSLETGTVLDVVLSVNYYRIADCVSVSAVQEKCDEKRQGTHALSFPVPPLRGFKEE
jgi:hypothetical protein